MLGMDAESVVIPADDRGEMDYDELAQAAAAGADRPAIVVATVGTTMTEAVDDVGRIHAALDAAGISDGGRHCMSMVLSPACLSPWTLGPIAAYWRDPPQLDVVLTQNGVCISGHKFFATPHINGVVLAAQACGAGNAVSTTSTALTRP